MSTKIYNAYRMPIGCFDGFLLKFRRHVFKEASKLVKGLLDGHLTGEHLQKLFKDLAQASKKLERDPYCIDCSLNIWFHSSKFYVIPYGESFLWDKFKLFPKVEEYCYWNNSDKPDELTHRQWKQRSEIWNKVCLDDWDKTRMVHEVINASSKLGLFEVGKRIIDEEQARAATVFWLKP